jgi:hypothetical protein
LISEKAVTLRAWHLLTIGAWQSITPACHWLDQTISD